MRGQCESGQRPAAKRGACVLSWACPPINFMTTPLYHRRASMALQCSKCRTPKKCQSSPTKLGSPAGRTSSNPDAAPHPAPASSRTSRILSAQAVLLGLNFDAPLSDPTC